MAPVKDDPPAYNELFKSFQAKSAAKGAIVREEINSIDRTLATATVSPATAGATKEPSAKKSSLDDIDSRTDSPLPPPYRSDTVIHIV